MKFTNTLSMGLMLATLATGCNQPASEPKATPAPATPAAAEEHAPHGAGPNPAVRTRAAEHAPHGAGPNGGVVFDLGKYHAEFTVDHPTKECTVLFVTGDAADAQPLPVVAKEFTLSIKETKTADGTVVAPMTVTLLPKDEQDGKAAKFVGTDPGIGNVADFEGTVLGEIDGKPSQGEFKE